MWWFKKKEVGGMLELVDENEMKTKVASLNEARVQQLLALVGKRYASPPGSGMI